jgi:hypothetical protein
VFNAYVYLLFPFFQAILLTLAILSTTYFEIAVNLPTYLPERDNSFPEAEHEAQFTTESQNPSKSLKFTGRSQFEENPYSGGDANQRNLSRGDGSDVNNQKIGKKLNSIRCHRNLINGHEGTEAFKANRIGSGTRTNLPLQCLCGDFNLTCMSDLIKQFTLRKINN